MPEPFPYIDNQILKNLFSYRELVAEIDGELFPRYEFGMCFIVDDNQMHCPGYLKLVEYLFPNISWLNAQKLMSQVQVDTEKEHDYYATRVYNVWVIHLNRFIDYAIDELQLQPLISIDRSINE